MYYKVHDFMIHDLELKGIDLNTFALSYSVKRYNGSLKTLCKNVGVNSINTVKSSLERLHKNKVTSTLSVTSKKIWQS